MGGAAGRPDRGRLRSGHYKATSLFGVGAPKATPVGIIGRLNKEINAALVDPKMRVRLADLGGTVLACSPADFGKLIAEETEKWGQVLSVYRAQASLGLPPRGTPPWRLQSTIATSSNQRHLMAASHRCAVARCAGKVREMELNLPTLPALERLRCAGEPVGER
jgi:hypothetical protein